MSVYYDENWDINTYRQAHESDEHWQLKQEFMEEHKGRFPEDRLVCLAQLYQNVELLGCRYPDETMRQVAELGRGLSKDYRAAKKSKLQRTFVKASDAAEARAKGTKMSYDDPNKDKNIPRSSQNQRINFQASSSCQGSFQHNTNLKRQGDESSYAEIPAKMSGPGILGQYPDSFNPGRPSFNLDQSLGRPSFNQSQNPGSFNQGGVNTGSVNQAQNFDRPSFNQAQNYDRPNFNQAQNPVRPSFNQAQNPGSLNQAQNPGIPSFNKAQNPGSFNQAQNAGTLNQGAVNQKIQSTVEKYKQAFKRSASPILPPDDTPVQNQRGLMATSQKFQPSQGHAKKNESQYISDDGLANPVTDYWESDHPLSELVLIQREYNRQRANAIGVLQNSANFCSIPVIYNYNAFNKQCTITVNGVRVATVEGVNKKDAKGLVAEKALSILVKYCYTIRIHKVHDSLEEVCPEEINTMTSGKGKRKNGPDMSGLDTPIDDDSNMGSKLMKLMGWTGGGLGKEGTGITEPIRPAEVFGRDGLGKNTNKSITQNFKNKIHSIVREYANGSGLGDLTFASEFTKEQRAEIHKISHMYKLKSMSHGKNANRYLVLSRKISPKNLLRQILEKGPTDKYEVIPPSTE